MQTFRYVELTLLHDLELFTATLETRKTHTSTASTDPKQDTPFNSALSQQITFLDSLCQSQYRDHLAIAAGNSASSPL